MSHETSLSKTQIATNFSEPAPLHGLLRSEIDASLRFSILLFFRTALFWLIVGSALSLIASLKLVIPSFLDGLSFLNYGRLIPTALDMLVYGWATLAGVGVSVWMIARLCGTPLRCTKLLTSAVLLWNVGVFLGSLAILSGYGTSVSWLEYPNWASFILFVAFLLMGVWVVLLFGARQPRSIYVSQWYFLAALCAFPWIYATGNMLLTWFPVQGSAQGPIAAWYSSNIFGLWLVPLVIGVVYYIIPKITGSAIYSYYLTVLGFFSLLFLSGWSGMTAFIGGPIPVWMVSSSIVATMLMIIPVAAVTLNYSNMLQSQGTALLESPALRFTVLGILAYVMVTALTVINAIPSVNALVHFTDYTTSITMLVLLGVVSMILFGGMYYITPRLFGFTWPCTCLISCHFWFAVIGVGLMVFSMAFGGLIEGLALNDPAVSFVNILSYANPWRWLVVCSWMLLLFSYFAFASLLAMMFFRASAPTEEESLTDASLTSIPSFS